MIATISFGLASEPEDSQYGKYRLKHFRHFQGHITALGERFTPQYDTNRKP